MAKLIKTKLAMALTEMQQMPMDELLNRRYDRLMSVGAWVNKEK